MKACSTQAQNFVTQIKGDRSLRMRAYNTNVAKNKSDIVKIFDTALAKYMKEGEMMRGLFGAGFSSPTGIKREVTGDKYLAKFKDATAQSPDGALLLEDPDKFVEMFKGNIALLKTEVQKQQAEIMGSGGRGGILAQHVDQTDKNYQVAKAKAEEISNNCIAKHDEYVRQAEAQRQQQMADMQKKMNELGEKRQDICALYTRAQSDSNGACNERVRDITAPVAGIYGEFQGWCASNGHNQQGEDASDNAISICLEVKDASGSYSAELVAFCKDLQAKSNPQKPDDPSCEKTITKDSKGNDVVTGGCEQLEKQIIGYYQHESRRTAGPDNGPPMPADCAAGYNGDRSVPEGGSLMGANPLQAMSQVLGQ
jgi:hypothetical protein